MNYYTREFLLSDNATRSSRADDIYDRTSTARKDRNKLLYGSGVDDLPGSVRRMDERDELLFGSNCFNKPRFGLTSSPNCTTYHNQLNTHGLNSVIEEFDRNVLHILAVTDFNATTEYERLTSNDFDVIQNLERKWMREGVLLWQYLLREEPETIVDVFVRDRLVVLMVFASLMAVMYAFMYVPLISQLQEDTVRTRSLLLIIPPLVSIS